MCAGALQSVPVPPPQPEPQLLGCTLHHQTPCSQPRGTSPPQAMNSQQDPLPPTTWASMQGKPEHPTAASSEACSQGHGADVVPGWWHGELGLWEGKGWTQSDEGPTSGHPRHTAMSPEGQLLPAPGARQQPAKAPRDVIIIDMQSPHAPPGIPSLPRRLWAAGLRTEDRET